MLCMHIIKFDWELVNNALFKKIIFIIFIIFIRSMGLFSILITIDVIVLD